MAKKKWAALSLSMLLILSLVVSAGTFALFTDTASNANNQFHAGTIDLETSPNPMYFSGDSSETNSILQNAIPGEPEGGWAPGDSLTRELVITNSGSLDAIITGVKAVLSEDQGENGLDEKHPDFPQFIQKMNVRIVDKEYGEVDGLLYDGSLEGLLNNGDTKLSLKQRFIVEAKNQTSRTIQFTVSMAQDANNNLQEKSWAFDFVFTAEQQRNNLDQPDYNKSISGTVYEEGTTNVIADATVDFGNGYSAITGSDGKYTLEIPAGTYSVHVSAEGYHDKTFPGIRIINQNETHSFSLMPVINTEIVSGKVTDAVTGEVIEGVNISFGVYEINTDTNGNYSIALPLGTINGTTSASSYENNNKSITVVAGGPNVLDFQLHKIIPTNGDWNITLSWNSAPSDLDAHLTGPQFLGNNSRFHVYFDADSYSFQNQLRARLDRDDVSPNGSETITISNQFTGANDVYKFYVHDYTNKNKNGKNDNQVSTVLGDSGAKVEVKKGTILMYTFYAPAGKGGTLWEVLEINGNKVTKINEMSYLQNENKVGESSNNIMSLADNSVNDEDDMSLLRRVLSTDKVEE